jgi:hypothetical protein
LHGAQILFIDRGRGGRTGDTENSWNNENRLPILQGKPAEDVIGK